MEMPTEELLNEVAARLVAWSEPLPPTPKKVKVTQESRMASSCSFFDSDDEDDSFFSSSSRANPLRLPPLRGALRQDPPPPDNRRQYANLHGRDTWNWDHA